MALSSRNATGCEGFSSEFRRSVSGSPFQFPERLVSEVGFKRPPHDPAESTKVVWHYNQNHEKAVLANDGIYLPSIEMVDSSAPYGVSNNDLESGDVSGTRITIIENYLIPLTTVSLGGRVVLKSVYAD